MSGMFPAAPFRFMHRVAMGHASLLFGWWDVRPPSRASVIEQEEGTTGDGLAYFRR
jgi:hypothetical protein